MFASLFLLAEAAVSTRHRGAPARAVGRVWLRDTARAMSQENVEIVRAIWRAFSRFEFPADAFSDDVVWHTAADMPDREACRGQVAVQQMLASGWGTVIDPGCEAEEFIDAGERVVVRWRGWGEGRASGVPIDWRESHIYLLHNSKVVEVREYRSWPEALAAAGLTE
jgi:ketosteroid isomerase-like protein